MAQQADSPPLPPFSSAQYKKTLMGLLCENIFVMFSLFKFIPLEAGCVLNTIVLLVSGNGADIVSPCPSVPHRMSPGSVHGREK